MQCMHINIRKATFILLSVMINYVNNIQMAENFMESDFKNQVKNNTYKKQEIFIPKPVQEDLVLTCPSDVACKDLEVPCLDCYVKYNCEYGSLLNATCTAKPVVKCIGERKFQRPYICRYCYQTDHWEHSCELKANCNSVASPKVYYTTNCTVHKDIICLGNRLFDKRLPCNWTGGYRWLTALALSVTLGGFGADRFYLGHWQEGIGKLFSFGGLGVWTLIDVILISLHYLGPADGSLFI
ncbi:TM2 domain-containing protein almondex [Coccinella septempunctata]|uniref:TM2 domain-containing protein almondex n=1 Tax=Coccinella septempunctata TaxID=41139 RepID=UPI001D06C615|nr:TM2 domain-containing protein almondex [Coccinella septempunctata]